VHIELLQLLGEGGVFNAQSDEIRLLFWFFIINFFFLIPYCRSSARRRRNPFFPLSFSSFFSFSLAPRFLSCQTAPGVFWRVIGGAFDSSVSEDAALSG